MEKFQNFLYQHQQEAIVEIVKYQKCLVNMYCGTGKTRVFTTLLFMRKDDITVFVFPTLGLINQYNNDYFLNEDSSFIDNFNEYTCLAFCSDDESKLKIKSDKIKYSTSENFLKASLKKNGKKLYLVTYQSFNKFIDVIMGSNKRIN